MTKSLSTYRCENHYRKETLLVIKVTRYFRSIILKLPDSVQQHSQSPHKLYAHHALQRYFQDVDLHETIQILTTASEQHSRQQSKIHSNQFLHPWWPEYNSWESVLRVYFIFDFIGGYKGIYIGWVPIQKPYLWVSAPNTINPLHYQNPRTRKILVYSRNFNRGVIFEVLQKVFNIPGFL